MKPACHIFLILSSLALLCFQPSESFGKGWQVKPDSTFQKDNLLKNPPDSNLINDSLTNADSLINDSVQSEKRDKNISPDAIKSEIDYKAKDSTVINMVDDVVYLYGDAEVNFENKKLNAAYIRFSFKDNMVYAEGLPDSTGELQGTPVFLEGETTYEAEKIAYNFDTKKGKLFNIRTKEGESYIHGEEVKKNQYDVIYAKDAKYTTCDKEHPHYYFAINKLKVIPEDKIVSGPAYAVVAGVPMPAFLPFGFFPNSKKQTSGIIIPGFQDTDNRGFALTEGGYYLSLSEKADLSITGDIFTQGSWRLQAASNYNNRYHYSGNFLVERANNIFGDPSLPSGISRDFRLQWAHQQAPKARPLSNFSADVNIASSDALRNNANNTSEIVRTNLNSSISYGTSFRNTPFSLNVAGNHDQNLKTKEMTVSLPNAALNMRRVTPFEQSKLGVVKNFGFNYNLRFVNEINTFDSLFFRPETLDELNYGFTQSINTNTSFKVLKYFSLNPGVNYSNNIYFERQARRRVQLSDSPFFAIDTFTERGIYDIHNYNFQANLNTRLYGMMNINAMGMRALRHVVTPRISASYQPDFSRLQLGYYDTVRNPKDSLITYSYYKQNVFGGATQGENASLGFSLGNVLEMKVDDKNDTANGTKKIKLIDNFNLSSSYNFLADSLKLAPIRLDMNTSLLEVINIRYTGTINPYYLDPADTVIKDRFAISETGSIGRLTASNIQISTNLNPRVFSGEETAGEAAARFDYLSFYGRNYVDFQIPWSLNLSYSRNVSMNGFDKNIRSGLQISGDLKITDKWKVRINTNYDLVAGEFTTSQVNIFRDLHCWQMSLNWIPFGFRQSYGFEIRVKSTILQDLKLEKNQQFFDNRN